MPSIKRVISDHGKTFCRNRRLVFDDAVEVLIMAPGEEDVVKATAFAVDAELAAVDWVRIIRVVLEGV
jgi:hypothetical protein